MSQHRITDIASVVVGELRLLPESQERADTILDCVSLSEKHHTLFMPPKRGEINPDEFREPEYSEAIKILQRHLRWAIDKQDLDA